MMDTGVQGVTVLASEIAEPDENDTVWWERVEKLVELTDPIPLALYECPQPYHRLIAPELVEKAAITGRFHLLKETSRSIDQVIEKTKAAAGTPLQIFNADATTLLASLRAGAKGYCGIAANFYPKLLVWLCAYYEDDPDQAEKIQSLMGMADATIHHKYPMSAKFYRNYEGQQMLSHSKVSDITLDNYDKRVLQYIADQMRTISL